MKLDKYFNNCGVIDATMIRAGEHSVLPGIVARSSDRAKKQKIS